ncbi:MAG: glycosyltransferase, partial [Rhodothermales bacterium]|nr:glycosyltransferase [Rhodothermales bacterium]
MEQFLRGLQGFTEPIALGFTVLVALGYLILMVAAVRRVWAFRTRRRALSTVEAVEERDKPAVSIIVPMFNEELVCVASIRSFLSVRYTELEVIAVNDGSGDGTLRVLSEAFDLQPVHLARTPGIVGEPVRGAYQSRRHPNLFVIDKENGGRSDAVNTGLAHAANPLFCVVDADSVLDPQSVTRLVEPFLKDRRTVATGGNVRIMNGCRMEDGMVQKAGVPSSAIEGFQTLEYLRAFVSARLGWSRLNSLMIISGALGLFRRDLVVQLGGLDVTTIGEDMELTVRIHRHLRERDEPYRIVYVPDAVIWTECPPTRAILGRQRDRWHRGLMEILARHRGMLFNPRYGRIGLIGMPWTLLVEFLGPLLEAVGYVLFVAGLWFGWFSFKSVAVVVMFALALGLFQSTVAVFMEEAAFRRYGDARSAGRLIKWLLLENLGYRQMTVYWRLRGMLKYLRGDTSWGEMTRTGAGSMTTQVRIACWIFLVGLGAAFADPATAQTAVSLVSSSEHLTQRPERWTATELTLSQSFNRGALVLKGGQRSRPGGASSYAGIDLYRELTTGLYAHVFSRLASPGTLPALWSGASIHGYVGPSEISVGVRAVSTPEDRLASVHLGMIRFWERMSLGGTLSITPSASTPGAPVLGGGLRLRVPTGLTQI